MNKYLTGLVAVAAVTTMGATSIPASAETVDDAKLVIKAALDAFTVTNNTTSQDIEDSYASQISNYAGISTDANISIDQEATTITTGAAVITVNISTQTTPAAATLTVNKEIALLASGDEVNVEDKVKEALKNLSLDNYSRSYDVYEAVKAAIYDMNEDISIHNFKIALATDTTQGVATGTIVLTNWDDGTTIKIPFSLPVSKGTPDENHDERYNTLDNAYDAIYEALKTLNISYNTSEDTIKNCAQSAIAKKNLPVTISNFYLEKHAATDTEVGYISYGMQLTDNTNNLTEDCGDSITIDTALTAKLRTSVNTYLDSLVLSNNINEEEILAGITKAINDPSIKIKIYDFYLRKATSDVNGFFDLTVNLEYLDGKYLDMPYSSKEFISKTGTGTSGGSGNHSSSSSSSSTSSTSATGTATTLDATKLVSLANMSKEAVKAVEAKVISNISMIIGTGATAGQAKEIATADGSKLSVTTITKDGKSAGAVITAEAPSAKAVIPIDKDQAQVAAVYKYVPLLGKYIQVQDAVITADAVTLPVQANATYVASPVVMGAAETIKQGWVQANNSWYMVNATGDPLTGWQKDSTGWTYMSSDTGVMQTGWAQTGGNWYYLKSNGYMSTGWVQDGATWYYCKSDGSMGTGWVQDGATWYYCNPNGSIAANTTVDGYQLDASGAWIG